MPHNSHKRLGWVARFAFAAASLFLSAHFADATNLRFAWNASADPNVVGYNLSYGTTSGKYTKSINAGGSTSASVGLTPGSTYYFVVTAYNNIGLHSPPSNEVALTVVNKPPKVSLTSPQSNSSFSTSSSIGLSADASDDDGTITKVEFYRDTNKIGESKSAPYATTWNNPTSGSFTLTALAFDDSGAAVRSSGVPISISGGSPGANPTPNSANKVKVLSMTPIVRAGGIGVFKVVSTQASATDTVVNYSLGGNATGGVNYSMAGMNGQITIPAGQRGALMAMQTLPAATGSAARCRVTMSVAPGNGYTPGRGNAVVRILGH